MIIVSHPFILYIYTQVAGNVNVIFDVAKNDTLNNNTNLLLTMLTTYILIGIIYISRVILSLGPPNHSRFKFLRLQISYFKIEKIFSPLASIQGLKGFYALHNCFHDHFAYH